MENTNLPTIEKPGIFVIGASQLIDEPKEKVWKILKDFPSYKEWNPFVRSAIITNKPMKPEQPERDQTLRVGKYIYMSVHLPPSMDDAQPKNKVSLRIITVDEEKFRVAWVTSGGLIPRWLLHSVRWQAVSTVDSKTLYESREVFYGPLAYVVQWYVGSKLEAGFEAMGKSLKVRAETHSNLQ